MKILHVQELQKWPVLEYFHVITMQVHITVKVFYERLDVLYH
jgi:hypothetical protein